MNIAVIADDLTGANDTGVQMARQGLATSVLLELKTGGGKQEAVVFDTDSRSLPPGRLIRKLRMPVCFWGAAGKLPLRSFTKSLTRRCAEISAVSWTRSMRR